jgi:hypothetical protein
VYSPSLRALVNMALLPLTTIVPQAFAAYLTALGVTSFSEARQRTTSCPMRWLTQPELLAGLVLALVVLVNVALRPLTLTGIIEKRLIESRACSHTRGAGAAPSCRWR